MPSPRVSNAPTRPARDDGPSSKTPEDAEPTAASLELPKTPLAPFVGGVVGVVLVVAAVVFAIARMASNVVTGASADSAESSASPDDSGTPPASSSAR